MHNRQTILDALDAFAIPYQLHEHSPVHTIDECYTVRSIDFSRTETAKNVLLCNRQQTAFYLLLLRHDVPFRTAAISRQLGVSRLSFAPETLLPELLGLEAGAVSPFGLLFDAQQRVTLVIDSGLRGFETLAFHPCDNTATVVITQEDFSTFLQKINRQPLWVAAEKEASP